MNSAVNRVSGAIDQQDIDWLNHVHYATVALDTRTEHITLIVRENFVVLVYEDGRLVKGSFATVTPAAVLNVYLHGYILISTGVIQKMHVLEN